MKAIPNFVRFAPASSWLLSPPLRKTPPSGARSSHTIYTLTGAMMLAALAAACGRTEPAAPAETSPPPWTLAVEPLAIPSADGSVAPQLTGSSRGIIVSWIEPAGDGSALRFSERTSSGLTPPATVASANNWFISWADVPAVVRLSNGTLVSNWFVTTREQTEAYDLYLSYSTDDGRTWARAFKPHRDRTETQHGFPTLLELPEGGVGLLWLDGRDMDNNTTHPEGGVMQLRYTSFDPSWKQGADVLVNNQVCECCQTAAVVTADGVLAAFRDRSDADIRDIALSRLESGKWTDAQVLHADNWEVYACPVNGPALDGSGRELAAAWFTMKNEQGYAYAAFSHDAGRTWTTPVQLNEEPSLGYVDLEMLDDGSAAVSWVEYADSRRRLRVRRVEPSGAASPPVDVAGVSGAGRVTGYPRMARHGDELVFAWTESTTVEGPGAAGQQIKGALARIPRTTAP